MLGGGGLGCPAFHAICNAKGCSLLLLDTSGIDSTVANPQDAATLSGLRYVSDAHPGIKRKKAGAGYVHTATGGAKISAKDVLERIRSLAIPPAWTDVWI